MTTDFDLSGSRVLVTGASRGLGREIARAMAAAGADVVVGVRDLASATDVLAQIGAEGHTATALELDVTRLDPCRHPGERS
jgi:NAD(P)-dependent dehydrogenase (short-subunit alcohol dehydrogenase family)